MKHILITGANSYIGRSFKEYIDQFPQEYNADCATVRGAAWQQIDFSKYDIILHAAGIVHRKDAPEQLYTEVNRNLTIDIAKAAKAAGAKQFIFLSTMSVYGMIEGVITEKTAPQPNTPYGKSKLQAEEALQAQSGPDFKVAILRPPMIYGPGCKGNYVALEKLAQKAPLFPDYKNKRSAVSIAKLCQTIKEIIDAGAQGIFFPQDSEYLCTSAAVKQLAAAHGRRLRLTKLLNPAVVLAKAATTAGKKAFGDLIYKIEE